MTKKLYEESHVAANSAAIRSKLGGTTLYRLQDQAAAIESIPTGGASTLVSKTNIQNGEYDPADDNADGYSRVIVAVPAGGGGNVNVLYGYDYPDASIGIDGDVYLLIQPSGVKNTLGQYIDTGYSGNSLSKYVIDFSLTEAQSTEWPTLFGVRDSVGNVSNGSYYSAAIGASNYAGANIAWGNAGTNIQGIGANAFVGKRCQISMQSDSVKVTIDGVKTSHTITTGSLTQTQAHMGIFALIAGGSAASFSGTRGMILYGFKIYESNILVHDFSAAKDANDIPCIYDRVTDQYIYHSGGGSLTYVEDGEIFSAFVKVSGVWKSLIGANISGVIT